MVVHGLCAPVMPILRVNLEGSCAGGEVEIPGRPEAPLGAPGQSWHSLSGLAASFSKPPLPIVSGGL
jgi:hypothetical protein